VFDVVLEIFLVIGKVWVIVFLIGCQKNFQVCPIWSILKLCFDWLVGCVLLG